MKYKIFVRPSLAIIFVFIGAFVARNATPPAIFAVTGNYFLIVAALAFGVLGFILPEILELATKAGIAALAIAIARYLQGAPSAVMSVPGRFPRRTSKLSKYTNPLVVDTSVLIDGRIADIAKSGFILGTLIVIPSVVSELHKLSDSAEDLKRGRGRRGLDVLNSLRRERRVKVEILRTEPRDEAVDDKLVVQAKKMRARLLTVDFNLNKVASALGVSVLNINELTNAVKTAVLPHETLTVDVKAVGKAKDQGVAYLGDGTMVVVEGGSGLVGKTVRVIVHRVIQTDAGKMIFGKPQI